MKKAENEVANLGGGEVGGGKESHCLLIPVVEDGT